MGWVMKRKEVKVNKGLLGWLFFLIGIRTIYLFNDIFTGIFTILIGFTMMLNKGE